MFDKKFLVVDPGYKGGIERASIYLYDYLIDNGINSRYVSFKDQNDVPKNFSIIKKICDYFKPNFIFIHEYKNLELFAILKQIYPEIIMSYFSLPNPDHDISDSYYSNKCLDFLISPAYKKITDNKIPWSFNFPSRFFNAYSYGEKKENSAIYVGRLVEDKLSSDFIKLIGDTEIYLDAYGNSGLKDLEYLNLLKSSKNLKLKGTYSNYNIENLYRKYEIAVLPSTTDCYSLFMVEAILCGCYPFVMLKHFERRYPWMDLNFPSYATEKDMVSGIKEFMALDKNTKISLQERIKNQLVTFLNDSSSLYVIKDILENSEGRFYKPSSLLDNVDYTFKY